MAISWEIDKEIIMRDPRCSDILLQYAKKLSCRGVDRQLALGTLTQFMAASFDVYQTVEPPKAVTREIRSSHLLSHISIKERQKCDLYIIDNNFLSLATISHTKSCSLLNQSNTTNTSDSRIITPNTSDTTHTSITSKSSTTNGSNFGLISKSIKKHIPPSHVAVSLYDKYLYLEETMKDYRHKAAKELFSLRSIIRRVDCGERVEAIESAIGEMHPCTALPFADTIPKELLDLIEIYIKDRLFRVSEFLGTALPDASGNVDELESSIKNLTEQYDFLNATRNEELEENKKLQSQYNEANENIMFLESDLSKTRNEKEDAILRADQAETKLLELEPKLEETLQTLKNTESELNISKENLNSSVSRIADLELVVKEYTEREKKYRENMIALKKENELKSRQDASITEKLGKAEEKLNLTSKALDEKSLKLEEQTNYLNVVESNLVEALAFKDLFKSTKKDCDIYFKNWIDDNCALREACGFFCRFLKGVAETSFEKLPKDLKKNLLIYNELGNNGELRNPVFEEHSTELPQYPGKKENRIDKEILNIDTPLIKLSEKIGYLMEIYSHLEIKNVAELIQLNIDREKVKSEIQNLNVVKNHQHSNLSAMSRTISSTIGQETSSKSPARNRLYEDHFNREKLRREKIAAILKGKEKNELLKMQSYGSMSRDPNMIDRASISQPPPSKDILPSLPRSYSTSPVRRIQSYTQETSSPSKKIVIQKGGLKNYYSNKVYESAEKLQNSVQKNITSMGSLQNKLSGLQIGFDVKHDCNRDINKNYTDQISKSHVDLSRNDLNKYLSLSQSFNSSLKSPLIKSKSTGVFTLPNSNNNFLTNNLGINDSEQKSTYSLKKCSSSINQFGNKLKSCNLNDSLNKSYNVVSQDIELPNNSQSQIYTKFPLNRTYSNKYISRINSNKSIAQKNNYKPLSIGTHTAIQLNNKSTNNSNTILQNTFLNRIQSEASNIYSQNCSTNNIPHIKNRIYKKSDSTSIYSSNSDSLKNHSPKKLKSINKSFGSSNFDNELGYLKKKDSYQNSLSDNSTKYDQIINIEESKYRNKKHNHQTDNSKISKISNDIHKCDSFFRKDDILPPIGSTDFHRTSSSGYNKQQNFNNISTYPSNLHSQNNIGFLDQNHKNYRSDYTDLAYKQNLTNQFTTDSFGRQAMLSGTSKVKFQYSDVIEGLNYSVLGLQSKPT